MGRVGNLIRALLGAAYRAYRRVPVRWRLGGGSAALTFVILAGFAGVTDVLTNRQYRRSLYAKGTSNIAELAQKLNAAYYPAGHTVECQFDIFTFAESDDAQIRVFAANPSHKLLCSQRTSLQTLDPVNRRPFFSPRLAAEAARRSQAYFENGYRVNVEQVPVSWKPVHPEGYTSAYLIYALPLSSLNETISEVRLFLTAGVVGGAILALLAGLIVAQRAMRPIASLTEAAREIERTRDATLRIPHPEAEDEVAELARTLESMLGALNAARNESETALVRQREFVADASHELRTPLTSVLANLELLADELSGEQADSANAALRSTRRMRRLVADLLLLARADVGRFQALKPTDLGLCLTDAAAEITPALTEHELMIDARPATVRGITDDLHRLILNLIENAISHTPPGTHINASTVISGGRPTLIVQDDGPGIPPSLQHRVFERFVRGGGDTGHGPRGTGLGLSIVRAVADVHQATVLMESIPEFEGTRFTVTFPRVTQSAATPETGSPESDEPEPEPAQTSTTTGRTIGRRRNRS
jgi:signal transduction histidine kinase